MSKKTKTEFLAKFATRPELAKFALAAGRLPWGRIVEMGQDAYAANSGAVPGMICYTNTVKFAKKNHLLILKAISEYEKDMGARINNIPSPAEDEDEYFNWLTWFAWESTISDVLNYLENE
jgi:hypothetical protein